MSNDEQECPNCGRNNEVAIWQDGHCYHCGLEYYWREWNSYEEDILDEVVLIWDSTFADLDDC